MIQYKKASINEISELSKIRVSMLCENKDYDDEFKNKLYNNTFQYFETGIQDNNISLWIAVFYNKIVAVCCLNYFFLPPNELCLNGKTAHLGNMYTKPDFRKKGIASKLLELAIDDAKENQCERIILVPTDMGKPLYEKFGFKPWFDSMVFFPIN